MPTEFEGSAAKFIRYFERLVDADEPDWERQLLVAELWQRLLPSPGATRETFAAFTKELRAEADLGTAYDELVYEVGRWAEDLDRDPDRSDGAAADSTTRHA